MIKLREIFTYGLSLNTIKELRKWFNKPTNNSDCVISIGTEADIDTKDAMIIHCSSAGWMPKSYLDTKIIAKICIIRMSLN